MLSLLTHLALAAPLDAPALLSPADGGEAALDPTLSVTVAAAGDAPLTVTFRGRAYAPPGDDFTLIAMPDTQFYACGCSGGSTETFGAQTGWVAEQIDLLNVAYVAQLGDCVENGDEDEGEWIVADEAFAAFDEDRSAFALPVGGLPYGVAVGNHDQSPMGNPDGTSTYYNAYFGYDRFYDRGWYGGYYGSNYDNHYDLFESGDTAFVALYFEYDPTMDVGVLSWASDVVAAYPDRHAIAVSHYLLGTDGRFGSQGQDIYDALSVYPNFGLMLAGHVAGEAARTDDGARTVHSLLSDYQSRSGGGDGWLRIMRFSPSLGQISVSTYSPVLDAEEADADSAFDLDWDPNPAEWIELGTVEVTDGEASLAWTGLSAVATYEWTAELSDGTEAVRAGPWTFTAVEAPGDTGDTAGEGGDDDTAGEGGEGGDDTQGGEGGEGGDSAPPADDSEPSGADSDTPSQDTASEKVAGGGCGCASGPGLPSGALLGLALVWGRRRRP